jgi:hypothetical protein
MPLKVPPGNKSLLTKQAGETFHDAMDEHEVRRDGLKAKIL